ncbi:MAG: HK97 gp10 family phage protein [Pirellulales bacterium]
MAVPALVLDQQTTARTLAYLTAIAKAGPKVAADSLNHAAQTWQREVVRHCPVDNGLLRASINVAFATESDLTALVGTNVPYAVFVEFDPGGRMAGGKVKAWQPGDPVILNWPAKSRDARGDNAASGAREEFMPPFRGSWQVVAPRIIENLRRRLASLLEQNRIK